MNTRSNRWVELWLEHFFRNAKPVMTLPVGWCVYREPEDGDSITNYLIFDFTRSTLCSSKTDNIVVRHSVLLLVYVFK